MTVTPDLGPHTTVYFSPFWRLKIRLAPEAMKGSLCQASLPAFADLVAVFGLAWLMDTSP